MGDALRSQFVGTHEFRKNRSKLLAALREEGREIVITQQGKPTAVIVDLEKHLEVQRALREFSDPAYLAALLEAKQEIREGNGTEAAEVCRQKGL